MDKKIVPINYTSRDFDTIRRDLENFAKRYYPNTYQDFNRASFRLIDVGYGCLRRRYFIIYVDYQTNESFLDSALSIIM